MRYLIIPPWLSSQQAALRFGNSAYLDLNQLEKVISAEDLSIYMALQSEFIVERLIGRTITRSHLQPANFKGELEFLDNARIHNLTSAYHALWNQISDAALADVIFAGVATTGGFEHVTMKPMLISGDTVGIFFEYAPQVNVVESRRAFIESLINVLYAFNAFEVIAAQPYFKEYLHIMRKGYIPPRAVLDVYCNYSW